MSHTGKSLNRNIDRKKHIHESKEKKCWFGEDSASLKHLFVGLFSFFPSFWPRNISLFGFLVFHVKDEAMQISQHFLQEISVSQKLHYPPKTNSDHPLHDPGEFKGRFGLLVHICIPDEAHENTKENEWEEITFMISQEGRVSPSHAGSPK